MNAWPLSIKKMQDGKELLILFDDNFKFAEIDSSNFVKDLQKEKVKEGFGNLKIALKKYFHAKDIRVNTEIIDACKDY